VRLTYLPRPFRPTAGNQRRAATLLGIKRTTRNSKIKRYKVLPDCLRLTSKKKIMKALPEDSELLD